MVGIGRPFMTQKLTCHIHTNEVNDFLWKLTRSICPECKRIIDAQILFRENRVIMWKECPEHGEFEALVFSDAKLYEEIIPYEKPGTLPLEFATEVKDGCPYDCGICPDHKQHSCTGLIEVNSICNLSCPLCFADANSHLTNDGFKLNAQQVEYMIDRFIAAEGKPEVLQFSGGEPTLHPDIIKFIDMAKQKGIEHVMLNTNGIRIAHDDKLLKKLADLKVTIYLQFDGFEENTYKQLRGRSDLADIKIQALERLSEANLMVVLVPAIEHGVNQHEIGAIVEFGIGHPAVFGVNFQPAFHAQRHIPTDPMTRITIPDILKYLEEQTDGLFQLSDFIPVPCCNPTCSFTTYAMLIGDNVTPLPRVLDLGNVQDYLKNRTLPGLNADLLNVLERLWSSSAKFGSEKTSAEMSYILEESNVSNNGHEIKGCPACQSHHPLSSHNTRDLGRHIFMVNTRDFMDPWTFDINKAMKCCVSHLVPDGRIIPFCTYNSVGYREQVFHTLLNESAIQ